MKLARRHKVLWTEAALQQLENLGDRRIQQQLFDTSKRLESDPEKQGKPLREELLGFRSLRSVGQRYRLVYSMDSSSETVYIVAAGLRREGARGDVYELAQKLVRLGLAPAPSTRKPHVRRKAQPKKK